MATIKDGLKRGILRSGMLSVMAARQPAQAVVLRYHSILENPAEHAQTIGAGIIHSTAAFEKQMDYLSQRCVPVTVDEVLAFARGEIRLRPRSVAVTFDDGYEDNLVHAVPIMNRHGVRGAIYVMTEYVDAVPWYCTLRYIFATTQRTSFIDPFDGSTRSLVPPQRRESYLSASRACAATPREKIDGAMAALEAALDVEYRPSSRIMLTWDGVREVVRQGHIIGSHSRTHPNMAYIDGAERADQMRVSREILERETGAPIRHFSYPSPIMEPHWTEETIGTCREAGYDTAVTCAFGAVRGNDNPLAMKRLFAHQTIDAFQWAIENLFAGRRV